MSQCVKSLFQYQEQSLCIWTSIEQANGSSRSSNQVLWLDINDINDISVFSSNQALSWVVQQQLRKCQMGSGQLGSEPTSPTDRIQVSTYPFEKLVYMEDPQRWTSKGYWAIPLGQGPQPKLTLGISVHILAVFIHLPWNHYGILQEQLAAMGIPVYSSLVSSSCYSPHFKWIPSEAQCRKISGNATCRETSWRCQSLFQHWTSCRESRWSWALLLRQCMEQLLDLLMEWCWAVSKCFDLLRQIAIGQFNSDDVSSQTHGAL